MAAPKSAGDKAGWGVLDGQRYAYRWDVPWGAGTTLGGMALWFTTFVAVALVTMPGLYTLLGERHWVLAHVSLLRCAEVTTQ